MIPLLLSLALAQDPAPPVDDRPPEIPAEAELLPDEPREIVKLRPDGQPEYLEIIVVSPLAVLQARDDVVRAMTAVGWKSRRRKDGTVVFRGPEGWMGKATLLPSGDLEFDQPVLAFGGVKDVGSPYDATRKTADGYMGGGTVGVSTIPLPNKEIVRRAQSEIAVAVKDKVDAYRTVLRNRHFSGYVADLPVRLDALWTDGTALDGGDPIPEPARRRKAALDFWATRTNTPEGRTISRTVEVWLREVVMTSAFPVTPEEAAAAEARREDDRKLDLF